MYVIDFCWFCFPFHGIWSSGGYLCGQEGDLLSNTALRFHRVSSGLVSGVGSLDTNTRSF